MSRNMAVAVSVWGGLILFSCVVSASAQWYPARNSCCAVPVQQTCYRTVPVTEYQQVRQVVQRPVYETKYVDQQVTAYRPINESRTVDVPTVSYQNVTEYRTVTRDQGRWVTNYECRQKISPCQYDNRPNLWGWFNRTGYSVRSAFTPKVVTRRQYVPNLVAYQVPVTRQVAHRGTRKVTYNVTRMEPYQATRKVAVNSVRYVATEVVTQRPVTVMRTVPIGTRTAFSYAPFGAPVSRTALQPRPDRVGSAGSSSPKRTATNRSNFEKEKTFVPKKYERDSSALDEFDMNTDDETPIRKSSYRVPQNRTSEPPVPQAYRAKAQNTVIGRFSSRSLPSVVMARKWTARTHTGPSLVSPSITVANAGR